MIRHAFADEAGDEPAGSGQTRLPPPEPQAIADIVLLVPDLVVQPNEEKEFQPSRGSPTPAASTASTQPSALAGGAPATPLSHRTLISSSENNTDDDDDDDDADSADRDKIDASDVHSAELGVAGRRRSGPDIERGDTVRMGNSSSSLTFPPTSSFSLASSDPISSAADADMRDNAQEQHNRHLHHRQQQQELPSASREDEEDEHIWSSSSDPASSDSHIVSNTSSSSSGSSAVVLSSVSQQREFLDARSHVDMFQSRSGVVLPFLVDGANVGGARPEAPRIGSNTDDEDDPTTLYSDFDSSSLVDDDGEQFEDVADHSHREEHRVQFLRGTRHPANPAIVSFSTSPTHGLRVPADADLDTDTEQFEDCFSETVQHRVSSAHRVGSGPAGAQGVSASRPENPLLAAGLSRPAEDPEAAGAPGRQSIPASNSNFHGGSSIVSSARPPPSVPRSTSASMSSSASSISLLAAPTGGLAAAANVLPSPTSSSSSTNLVGGNTTGGKREAAAGSLPPPAVATGPNSALSAGQAGVPRQASSAPVVPASPSLQELAGQHQIPPSVSMLFRQQGLMDAQGAGGALDLVLTARGGDDNGGVRYLPLRILEDDGRFSIVQLMSVRREPSFPNPIKLAFALAAGSLFGVMGALFFAVITVLQTPQVFLRIWLSGGPAPLSRVMRGVLLFIPCYLLGIVGQFLYGLVHGWILGSRFTYSKSLASDFIGFSGIGAAFEGIIALTGQRWELLRDITMFLQKHRSAAPPRATSTSVTTTSRDKQGREAHDGAASASASSANEEVAMLLCPCIPFSSTDVEMSQWWVGRQRLRLDGAETLLLLCCGYSYCGNMRAVDAYGISEADAHASSRYLPCLCCVIGLDEEVEKEEREGAANNTGIDGNMHSDDDEGNDAIHTIVIHESPSIQALPVAGRPAIGPQTVVGRPSTVPPAPVAMIGQSGMHR